MNVDSLRLVCHLLTSHLHRIDSEKELDYSFWHDTLTGLYNLASSPPISRNSISRNFLPWGFCLPTSTDSSRSTARSGYEFGNQILLDTARIFREYFPDAYLFRLGGNEFCIICENTASKDFYDQIALLKADPAKFQT